jgi:hypothetical protein
MGMLLVAVFILPQRFSAPAHARFGPRRWAPAADLG